MSTRSMKQRGTHRTLRSCSDMVSRPPRQPWQKNAKMRRSYYTEKIRRNCQIAKVLVSLVIPFIFDRIGHFGEKMAKNVFKVYFLT